MLDSWWVMAQLQVAVVVQMLSGWQELPQLLGRECPRIRRHFRHLRQGWQLGTFGHWLGNQLPANPSRRHQPHFAVTQHPPFDLVPCPASDRPRRARNQANVAPVLVLCKLLVRGIVQLFLFPILPLQTQKSFDACRHGAGHLRIEPFDR